METSQQKADNKIPVNLPSFNPWVSVSFDHSVRMAPLEQQKRLVEGWSEARSLKAEVNRLLMDPQFP